MAKAFVAIVTSAKMSPSVIEHLEEISEVADAHIVAGEFDIIVELEAPNTNDLLPIVTRRIQGVEGVGHTRTYVVLD